MKQAYFRQLQEDPQAREEFKEGLRQARDGEFVSHKELQDMLGDLAT